MMIRVSVIIPVYNGGTVFEKMYRERVESDIYGTGYYY